MVGSSYLGADKPQEVELRSTMSSAYILVYSHDNSPEPFIPNKELGMQLKRRLGLPKMTLHNKLKVAS